MKRRLLTSIACAACLLLAQGAAAEMISGQVLDWSESDPNLVVGDGINHVTMDWSVNTFDRGWFYGGISAGQSNIALATGITAIEQIVDASQFEFRDSWGAMQICDRDCDPDGIGEFIIYRSNDSGHYGVLHVEDIHTPTGDYVDSLVDGTWWFLTDGSTDFSVITATEESNWGSVKSLYR